MNENMFIDVDKLERLRVLLLEKNYKIFLAESMSGGFISGFLSQLEGASMFFLGGIVCYSSQIKQQLLGVSSTMIENFTAESQEVTDCLLLGLKNIQQADIYISVTGLSGPGGSESAEKPIGTVFLSLEVGGVHCRKTKICNAPNPSAVVTETFNWLVDEILKKIK